MKLIPCPLNGLRNVNEFVYGGEVRDWTTDGLSDAQWTGRLFMRANAAGVVQEWWFHAPSAYWFILERNTITDEVIRSWRPDAFFAERESEQRP